MVNAVSFIMCFYHTHKIIKYSRTYTRSTQKVTIHSMGTR